MLEIYAGASLVSSDVERKSAGFFKIFLENSCGKRESRKECGPEKDNETNKHEVQRTVIASCRISCLNSQ
jgi:hypothetical protein